MHRHAAAFTPLIALIYDLLSGLGVVDRTSARLNTRPRITRRGPRITRPRIRVDDRMPAWAWRVVEVPPGRSPRRPCFHVASRGFCLGALVRTQTLDDTRNSLPPSHPSQWAGEGSSLLFTFQGGGEGGLEER
jgi:hypothetical protein